MSLPLPANESQRLETLHNLNILDTLGEIEFDDLTRLAAQICEVPISVVSLIDADRQWFKSKIGLDVSETPREAAFCTHTILEDKLFIVPNATEDKRFAENPLVIGDPNIRFYAGAPLITDEGDALGSICVIDRVPRKLKPEQKEALQALARQTMKLFNLRQQANEIAKANEELNREIIESHLMDNTAAAISIMENLHSLGIKISIDDFGTGYSSLSYIHRLPISFLKIDRSFVSQIQFGSENGEIIRTIIMLAKNLNIKVVAEGIETNEQAEFLKNLSCDLGQGYLYSKPVKAKQAELLFKDIYQINANRTLEVG